MNEIKVDMVKFLMTMFEGSSNNANEVKMFKSNVNALVARNQIPSSVRELIYNMYGISNTDTFKPNAQANKLMQINMLMLQMDGVKKTGSIVNINNFKNYVNNGVQQGTILKSARDIVFEIYDLDSNIFYNDKKNKPSLQDTTPIGSNSNTSNNGKATKSKDKNTKLLKSKEVLADIAQFKSQYVPEIYYEYPNPSYDGCSGSSRDLHKKLIDATERPNGATFVIHKLISDDGCHQTWSYVSVPTEYYKPTTSIKVPTMGSAVGCTGGGYSMRTC